MTKVAIATEEMSDLRRLCSIAIRAANSQTIDGADRCFDILCYLKKLSFCAKDLVRVSKEISLLVILKDHRNPKISTEAKALFLSWMRTLYSRDPSTCNNNTMLVKKTPAADLVAKACPDLKKKKFKRSVTARGIGAEEDQRSRVLEVCHKKQYNPNKAGVLAAKKPIQKKKKQPAALPENPRSVAHEAVAIKKHESGPAAVKKNSREMLELFEIAEKSADKASAKGILLSTKETSICVDTLSLLKDEFTISSTAPETKRIMKKLSYLTKHKDRKICNSATALLQHWRQSI
ncbi:Transcription elongation factor (TFIIS) family protein [Raphanus sativus]|uniref:Uncharacterized protein LOC108845377 n=1 Tax=Raphanus sativus TaxID=3726 RepID=A0A6J0MPN3_RAPSA|nr:uncharacterized protein LOC108845377 [Raphanus sativus]KAJ4907136.1 Transcription elongation factor (TFIIS) family protein [Raphanus sativus]